MHVLLVLAMDSRAHQGTADIVVMVIQSVWIGSGREAYRFTV